MNTDKHRRPPAVGILLIRVHPCSSVAIHVLPFSKLRVPRTPAAPRMAPSPPYSLRTRPSRASPRPRCQQSHTSISPQFSHLPHHTPAHRPTPCDHVIGKATGSAAGSHLPSLPPLAHKMGSYCHPASPRNSAPQRHLHSQLASFGIFSSRPKLASNRHNHLLPSVPRRTPTLLPSQIHPHDYMGLMPQNGANHPAPRPCIARNSLKYRTRVSGVRRALNPPLCRRS